MLRRGLPLWTALLLGLVAATVAAPAATGQVFGSPQEHHLAEPVVDGALVWTGDEALIFGGRNASGPQNFTQSFDPETGEARVLDAELPMDAQGSGVTWTGDEAYVFGGAGLIVSQEQVQTEEGVENVSRIEVNPHDEILRWDDASRELTTLETTLPDEVFGLAAAEVNGTSYIFGGVNRSETEGGLVRAHNQDWVLRFDPQADDPVKQVATLPLPLRDAAAVAHGGDVYVFGGIVEQGQGDNRSFEPSDAIYRFDPETGNVTTVEATLGAPMRWFSAAHVGDRAYLFGGCLEGCDELPDNLVDAVQVFRFSSRSLEVVDTRLDWGAYVATMAFYDGQQAWVVGGGQGSEQGWYQNVFSNATRFLVPPSEPRHLTAGAVAEGVGLDWTPPALTADGIRGYVVERARAGATPQPLALVDPGNTTYTDRTAEAGVNHTYRVRAISAGGSSPASDPVTVEAPERPPTPPERVEAAGLRDAVLVRWAEPSLDGGLPVDGYEVYRNGTHYATVNGTNFTDEDVLDDVTYSYKVSAVNALGEGPKSYAVEANTTDRLPPPEDLRLVPGNQSVRVSWEPPAQGAPSSYKVLRGSHWNILSPVATVDGESYLDSSVTEGTAYWYAVAAVENGTTGLHSQSQRVALLAPPGAPENVTVETEPGRAVVRWSPPSDRGGAEDIYYNVIRSDPGGSETFLNPDFWEETSWIDTDVRNGTTYTYEVEAVTSAGTGPRGGVEAHVPVPNTPPEARISASPADPHVGQEVLFDASNSTDAQDDDLEARWTFGAGFQTTWSPDLRTHHAFPEPGNYTVEVRVRDAHGAVSGPAEVTVSVSPAPVEDDDTGNAADEPEGGGGIVDAVPGPGPGLWAAAALGAGLARRRAGGRGRSGRTANP